MWNFNESGQLNSNLTNLKCQNAYIDNSYISLSTGLGDSLLNVLSNYGSKYSFFSITAGEFPDLPRTDWWYKVIAFGNPSDSMHVIVYRQGMNTDEKPLKREIYNSSWRTDWYEI